MNKNYYSNGIMRRMRQFTHDMTVNAHSKGKDIERLRKLKRDDEITQTVYDRELSAIQEGIKAQTVKVKTECKKDLMGTLEEMRRGAGNQIIKPPTQEMVSTLQLLAMLDDITPPRSSPFMLNRWQTVRWLCSGYSRSQKRMNSAFTSMTLTRS